MLTNTPPNNCYPNNRWKRMLIRVLLKDDEGLFNADCQVACLLDAIKQKHGLARTVEIDLCTTEGEIKALNLHGNDNGSTFFTSRELCLVVTVSDVGGHPFYTPVLTDYATNDLFLGMLNHKTEQASDCVRLRGRHKQSTSHRSNTPIQTHPSKSKSGAKAGQKKRRLSVTRVNN